MDQLQQSHKKSAVIKPYEGNKTLGLVASVSISKAIEQEKLHYTFEIVNVLNQNEHIPSQHVGLFPFRHAHSKLE